MRLSFREPRGPIERAALPKSTKLDPGDPSLTFALAIVCASATPLLLLDRDSKIIAASASFCSIFKIDPAEAVGARLFELGQGEWDVPQLRVLVGSTASDDVNVEAYEMELRRPGRVVRCLVVNVTRLALGASADVRLLVSIIDVTEARALARVGVTLAHDNAVLMQEVRHRVANSLQIIASVMMLNARRTSSEETRGHLTDAHNRVMSVADLQMQLAVSTKESVNLRSYLTKLCATIGASMIVDPKALVLSVRAPEALVEPEVSVSLGLIVTELVINALKHGFPDGAGGEIVVAYEQDGDQWTLSVSDNGLGMPTVESQAKAGLGTSIIQALGRQLQAEVVVERLSPGTRVSVARCPSQSDADPEHARPQIAV